MTLSAQPPVVKTQESKAFYSIPDLIDRWSISRSTIYNEIRRGKLRRRHVASLVRFALADVLEYEKKAG
jgi:predicted DNA-binding transcriptional regulator AlpA